MPPRHGGRRTPREPAAVSGPGSLSRRTDAGVARQPIDVPNVGESTDLVHGDRQRLEEAQRVAGVPRAATPRLSPAGGTAPPPPGTGGAPAGLPDFLFEESDRPDEPLTEGMPFGPGAGSEMLAQEPQNDQEVVLQFLIDSFNDEAAFQMLQEMRGAGQQAPVPLPTAPPQEAVAEEEGDLEAVEMDYGDEEFPEEEVAQEEALSAEEEEGLLTPEPESPEEAVAEVAE